jgi:hypothetical protein
MDRHRFLLVAIVASVTLQLALGAPVLSDATCSAIDISMGTCVTGTIQGPDAIIEGSQGAPGTGNSGSGVSDGPKVNPYCPQIVLGKCFGTGPDKNPPPQITVADIAAFRPNPGIDWMEPNGWMVVGLDTNFYSTGGIQVHDGTLLGQAASVRFTPIGWYWTYGDGASASRTTPGGTWASQSIREFDPTATSHIYRAAGTYVIDLTIEFRAEYRFAGGGWTPIIGSLAVPANRLVAVAGSAKTVLVERDCAANPAGPGC